MTNSKRPKDSGMISLEVAFFTLVFAAVLLAFFHGDTRTNLQTQLVTAKNNALKEAQLSGGLTSAITQQVINTLTLANADPADITVSSPQTTPVSYGGEIEIDITVTSKPTANIGTSGNPATNTTDALQAKGYVVSQYAP